MSRTDLKLTEIVLLFMFTAVIPCSGQTQSFSGSARAGATGSQLALSVDWEGRTVTIEITEPIPEANRNFPAARYRSEREIEARLPDYLRTALSGFTVTSRETAAEIVQRSPALMYELERLSTRAVKEWSRLTRDFSSISMRYSLPIHPELASLFVNHSRTYTPPRLLEYVPTAEYTGIVIYAKGLYPVRGESVSARLRPCLLPRIYDSEMNLLLSEGMVEPGLLTRSGLVSYSFSADESVIARTAGHRPLYLIAQEIFGVYRSDLVIPAADAAKILADERNRNLLTSGKILVICDEPR